MKLKFLGATQTVTGSKYLIESSGKRVMVDCGLFQGLKELRLRNWADFPVDPKIIDAVVLTHAHIDHTGYLPVLVKRGFKGRIYCTPATRDLCRVLLPDSGRLQEEEAEYANRKGFSKHKPALPLYTQADAENALRLFTTIDYQMNFALPGELQCVFRQSGHILGSAFVVISDSKRTIVFSGDLGRPNDLVLKSPEDIEKADYVVVESTYGNRNHDPKDILDQLEPIITRTIERKGVVIVPAFSVGRSQTLLYCLHLLKRARRIPDVPVFLNSPMSINATHIFCEYQGQHRLNPIECEGMCEVSRYVNSPEESKGLNNKKGPMIIISASGMATGGRALHHLKAFGPDSRNTILLSGFQAAGTRGAALVSGAKQLKIHGEQIPINAEIAVVNGLSAHADQKEILGWLSQFINAPIKAFVTHGEPASAEALKKKIEGELHWSCHVPQYLEEVDLS